jgi:hypothetical protein
MFRIRIFTSFGPCEFIGFDREFRDELLAALDAKPWFLYAIT